MPPHVQIDPRAHLEGRLVRRYKRFLADVEFPGGEIVTVHCPNPGRMLGTDTPGARVRCSTSDNPKRKLAHTLEMIRVGRIWVGLHTLRANQLVASGLAAGAIGGLDGYTGLRNEVRVGEGSRLDFKLEGHPRDSRDACVEVKSVTMAEGRRGLFPDAVTERGRKHLEVLSRLAGEGNRAALLFVVQRGDCESVSPADAIDPAYGEVLRRVATEGVELLAVRARVTASRIRLEGMLPVLL
ncbi:MAG: DNA/RNA nuclease SfsA [Deltaproteobacteria bacterium]|nr:MAG: DNA/RNA nuclease SfsA [Deltaproteobacteria bacterium]